MPLTTAADIARVDRRRAAGWFRTAAAALVLTMGAPLVHAADDQAVDQGPPRIVIQMPAPPTRPAALPVLYVTLAGLQAYDGYATLHGVNGAAQETNPLVGGLAQHPVAFWTIKAASTVTSIYFAEQLWRRRRRTEAVVLMVVANGVMGVVAARNTSILSGR
jgi:hypothetical protein